MTSVQLWRTAAANSRDAVNLMTVEIKDNAHLVSTVEKSLKKLRAATAAMEALQRLAVGLPEPKRGE